MVSQSVLLLGLLTGTTLAAVVPTVWTKRQDGCYNGGGNINNGDGPVAICTTYCENSNMQITGAPQNVSGHITCDTDSCDDAISQTYTSTETFTISIGGDSSVGDDTIKGGASVGASWSWSTSQATSDTHTFKLNNGDAGTIVFRPYYQQSCGDMKYFYLLQNDDGTATYCDTTPYAEDTNACGQTPIIQSNTQFADGDFTFCYDGGPNAGTGC